MTDPGPSALGDQADATNDETLSAAMSALRGLSPDGRVQTLPISQARRRPPPSAEDLAEMDARMEQLPS